MRKMSACCSYMAGKGPENNSHFFSGLFDLKEKGLNFASLYNKRGFRARLI